MRLIILIILTFSFLNAFQSGDSLSKNLSNNDGKTVGIVGDVKTNNKTEIASKISAGFTSGDTPILHATLYKGLLSHKKVEFYIMTALAQYEDVSKIKRAENLLLDTQGGLLNLQITLLENRNSIKNSNDSYGVSLFTGVKYDQINISNNETIDNTDMAIPYLGIVAQIDLKIFNAENRLEEGFWQFGLIANYEYLNDDMVNLLDNKVNNHEFVTELYSQMKINENFGLKVSYSTNLSNFQSNSKYFISFVLYPSSSDTNDE